MCSARSCGVQEESISLLNRRGVRWIRRARKCLGKQFLHRFTFFKISQYFGSKDFFIYTHTHPFILGFAGKRKHALSVAEREGQRK